MKTFNQFIIEAEGVTPKKLEKLTGYTIRKATKEERSGILARPGVDVFRAGSDYPDKSKSWEDNANIVQKKIEDVSKQKIKVYEFGDALLFSKAKSHLSAAQVGHKLTAANIAKERTNETTFALFFSFIG